MDKNKREKYPLFSFPQIDNESIFLFLRDYPPKSPQQKEWKELEKALKNEGKPKKPPRSTGFFGWQPIKKKIAKPRLAVIGEPIHVEFEMTNPLNIPIDLNDMRLIASYVEESSATPFEQEPQNISLAPLERRKLRFTIVPLIPGQCSIEGISFVLAKIATGRVLFELPRKRSAHQGHNDHSSYEPNLDLTLTIIADMPLLDIEFPQFPTQLFYGQLTSSTLVLKNTGKSPLRNLKVKVNPPGFFLFNPPESDDLITQWRELDEEYDPSIYHFSISGLEPGESFSTSLWLRCQHSGTWDCQFLFYYEPTKENPEMKYRLQRTSRTIKVTPAFKMTHHVSESHATANANLMNLELTSQLTSYQVHIRKVLPITSKFKFQTLNTNPEDFVCSIGKATNLYFKITPTEENVFEGALELSPFSQKILTSIHCGHLFQDKTSRIHEKNNSLLQQSVFPRDNNNNQSLTTTNSKRLNPQELDLIIVWEALDGPSTGFFGQHHMLDLMNLKKNEESSSMIRLHLQSETAVIHDFTQNPVCKIKIRFLITNISATESYPITLVALKPHEAANVKDDSYAAKRTHYFWSGNTSQNQTIPPKSEMLFEIDACFLAAGLFNVNRFRIQVNQPKKTIVPTKLQHIIEITAKE